MIENLNKVATSALAIVCTIMLTACGIQEESPTSQAPSGPISSQTPTPSQHEIWYENLITDNEYSLKDALDEHPHQRGKFDGEVIFDELRTGDTSENFNITVTAGDSIKLTIICDSNSSWESTFEPLYQDFFAGGESCLGMTGFETQPLHQDLPEWTIDIKPQDADMSYRLIVEIKGDK